MKIMRILYASLIAVALATDAPTATPTFITPSGGEAYRDADGKLHVEGGKPPAIPVNVDKVLEMLTHHKVDPNDPTPKPKVVVRPIPAGEKDADGNTKIRLTKGASCQGGTVQMWIDKRINGCCKDGKVTEGKAMFELALTQEHFKYYQHPEMAYCCEGAFENTEKGHDCTSSGPAPQNVSADGSQQVSGATNTIYGENIGGCSAATEVFYWIFFGTWLGGIAWTFWSLRSSKDVVSSFTSVGFIVQYVNNLIMLIMAIVVWSQGCGAFYAVTAPIWLAAGLAYIFYMYMQKKSAGSVSNGLYGNMGDTQDQTIGNTATFGDAGTSL